MLNPEKLCVDLQESFPQWSGWIARLEMKDAALLRAELRHGENAAVPQKLVGLQLTAHARQGRFRRKRHQNPAFIVLRQLP